MAPSSFCVISSIHTAGRLLEIEEEDIQNLIEQLVTRQRNCPELKHKIMINIDVFNKLLYHKIILHYLFLILLISMIIFYAILCFNYPIMMWLIHLAFSFTLPCLFCECIDLYTEKRILEFVQYEYLKFTLKTN